MLKVVNNRVMLEQKAYDFLNKVVRIILPAFATFYFTISKTFGLPDATNVIGTAASVCIFLGVLLHLSSANYNASGAAHVGTIALTPTTTGSTLALNLDPADVVNKKAISLAVVPPPPMDPPASPSNPSSASS